MKKEPIYTVSELIEILKKYPSETEVNHLSGSKETGKFTGNLFVIETNSIGDRDTEDIVELSFCSNPDLCS